MSVHYKFKSTLDYDTVSFDGLHISVADLKKAIFHQKRIGKNTDFDLQITNAQTKEDYTDDNALIAKNTSLIVARVPLTVQQKRSWDRNEQPAFANSKEESNMGRSVDLTRLDGSEEDKIRAMMTQSTQDYDPSNYMKIRGANQTGEVPPNYRCYKCHQPGHWIKNCPSGIDREPIEIKKSTGIPRSFMVPVEGPLVPGAMMTPTGQYAVPAIDHQAYKEGKKERPPFAQDPEPVVEKPEIPEDLLCNICKDLLTDAVMIPCCGNSFCDECIRTFLLESEEHECPDCNEKDVSPETLIPNRFLRNAVMNFKNETGYAKRKPYRHPQQPAVKLEKPKAEVDQPASSEENNEATVAAASQPSSVSNVSPQESVEKQPPVEVVEPVAIQQEYEEPPPALIVPAPSDSPPAPEIRPDSVPKLNTDEETEVPPPPGTEPLLPIPAIGNSPDADLEHNDGNLDDKKEHDDEYSDDQRPRERRRSFSKDSHRERTGDYGRRMENLRTVSRRRSLSPRNSQRGDYPPSSHSMNHPTSKSYQVPPPGNGRYQSSMHYCGDDRDIRRSTEDRPDTPTVDEPHLHGQQSVSSQQPPLLPYPPGEDRLPAQQSAPPPQPNYNQPPPNIAPHNALLPDPYMAHRIPLYPHQQGGPHYGPPRYDRPPYQQSGYRGSQIPRNYNGPPRPMRGMHHLGYRGVQPPPPGLGRNIHNGNPPGVIDDPLEAFERMLREKDERDRRLGKHRRRSRTRSRSRSYTRSRSRSFGRRSPLPPRISRSRSPPPKRRASRSPLPLRQRSRTPKRRSRSGSFSISRSRSYSRSQSPRGSLSRDRERERERERERDRERDRERERDLPPPRYRSPVRSPPPRFHRERERERPRSREPREPPGGGYNSYYNDSPAHDYGFRERERDLPPPPPRERPGGVRYPPRNHSSQHPIPPLLPHLVPGSAVHPPPLMSLGPPPPDRKDYYDSYNRYAGPAPQRFGAGGGGGGGGSPLRDTAYKRPFDDVAPPGTEGYYDLPPPGVDHPEKFPRDDREKSRLSKEHDERERAKEQEADDRERLPLRDERNRERDDRLDRGRERDDRIVDRRGIERERDRERDRDREDQRERPMSGREHQDRMREKEDRERREKEKERDERHVRDRREEERQIDKRDYEKERYRDERERHRMEEKGRGRERERKDRDYEMEKDRDRHDRYEGHSGDRKKVKKSSSPHPPKSRNEPKDPGSPERAKRKEKEHEERADEKKKEKKIKEKKKKKDGEEKEKKKKKKKEKRSTQKELLMKEDALKVTSSEVDSLPDGKTQSESSMVKVEEILSAETVPVEECEQQPEINLSKESFEDKSLAMNPEPPEASADEKESQDDTEFGTNPPNPNFKPIPEVKGSSSHLANPVESLYDGLDDTEINDAVVTEKYALLASEAMDEEEDSRNAATTRLSLSEVETASATSIPISLTTTTTPTTTSQSAKGIAAESDEKSPKKDEFLAQLPELSKWEREDTAEKFDAVVESPTAEEPTSIGSDESKSTKVVTSEVLKRAENAIFQKAINAIRPIEIKKISESRKILYQNPEPKIIEPEPAAREARKSVNVTINVGRNERNVEITEPAKKAKLDRTKFKPVPESGHSPTRLSAKERLGDKVADDEKERKPPSQPKNFLERRDSGKSEPPRQRSRSPRNSRDRRPSPVPERRAEAPPAPAPNVGNTERKVFLDERKRERNERPERPRERTEGRSERHEAARSGEARDARVDNRVEFRSSRNESRSERSERERGEKSERDRNERRVRTPPAQTNKREETAKAIAAAPLPLKRKEIAVPATPAAPEEEAEKKRDKKPKEEKKRKKEHRSRSKSKDRKRRKEKKHKRDKDKSQEKKQKHKDGSAANAPMTQTATSSREKFPSSDVKKTQEGQEGLPRAETTAKKQRKNPRLVSDRKRSVLDEANFEPDYSASDSDSDGEDGKSGSAMPAKKAKLEASAVETSAEKIPVEIKQPKKRVKSTSSEEYSTSDSDSSSSDTDSSEDSHRKRKKKHKKHKKRRSKKESSSESDSYSDSSYTSSDDRHKKKSKKSKSRSKQAKKKKKARHK